VGGVGGGGGFGGGVVGFWSGAFPEKYLGCAWVGQGLLAGRGFGALGGGVLGSHCRRGGGALGGLWHVIDGGSVVAGSESDVFVSSGGLGGGGPGRARLITVLVGGGGAWRGPGVISGARALWWRGRGREPPGGGPGSPCGGGRWPLDGCGCGCRGGAGLVLGGVSWGSSSGAGGVARVNGATGTRGGATTSCPTRFLPPKQTTKQTKKKPKKKHKKKKKTKKNNKQIFFLLEPKGTSAPEIPLHNGWVVPWTCSFFNIFPNGSIVLQSPLRSSANYSPHVVSFVAADLSEPLPGSVVSCAASRKFECCYSFSIKLTFPRFSPGNYSWPTFQNSGK